MDIRYVSASLSMIMLRLTVLRFSSLTLAFAQGTEPDFRHDIMPILSKSGCNTGACHGSGNGKGNLKLSLRGENPELDHLTLAGNLHSKRLKVSDPAASFVLRKPTKLMDHEGGRRFAENSPEYRMIYRWIANGAMLDATDLNPLMGLEVSPVGQIITEPQRTIQLRVTATYGNGTTADVTDRAIYEPGNFIVTVSAGGLVTARQNGETTIIVRLEQQKVPVRLAFLPARPNFIWRHVRTENAIDTHVFAKLRQMKTNPAEICTDAVFVRRAYMDLTGQPPSHEAARLFVADASPKKRSMLIDALLDSPAYAEWWAQKWSDLFRVEERVLDRTGTLAFYRWIRQSLAADKPMDVFVREVITGMGSTYENPPSNYYRALREPTLRAETTAQVFLGTRLACAKCHNHPFEHWTQNDYYSFSAIFDGLGYTILKDQRSDSNDKGEFVGEQIVKYDDKKVLKDPRTNTDPPLALLGKSDLPVKNEDRLRQLAEWLATPDHPLFAKVQVNRVWAHLMGRGLVDPVDDFRLTNPASNPELLESLAATFIAEGMRLKPLIRHICQSSTWQLAAEPDASYSGNVDDFSHATVRRWPAESIIDALYLALDLPFVMKTYPDVHRAGALPGARFITKTRESTIAESFLKEFGKPPRNTACECERTSESSLGQVFTLTSGPGVAALLRNPKNRLGKLLQSNEAVPEMLRNLYWAFLSRAPTYGEIEYLTPMLESSSDRRSTLEDIAWGLVNAKEFVLRY